MISYKPLQKLLIDKEMTKTDFIQLMEISTSTASKMWKNEFVAMKIIDDICEKFECTLHDVIEFIPAKKTQQKSDPIK